MPNRVPRRLAVVAATAVLGLAGCAQDRDATAPDREPLPGMPPLVVIVIVLCLLGAGALLWLVRRPVPDPPSVAEPVTPPALPQVVAYPGPRPPALTPSEFGISTVRLVGSDAPGRPATGPDEPDRPPGQDDS